LGRGGEGPWLALVEGRDEASVDDDMLVMGRELSRGGDFSERGGGGDGEAVRGGDLALRSSMGAVLDRAIRPRACACILVAARSSLSLIIEREEAATEWRWVVERRPTRRHKYKS